MEWISVKDRLPLKYEDVVNYDNVEVIVALCDNTVEVVDFCMGNSVTPWHQFGTYNDGIVTHWMPLPDPPK